MANYQNILRQAHQAIADVADNADSWRAFLRSAAYTTHYAFPNQALIYSQRPGATMLADIDTWNRAAGRWVNRGAHGVASLGTGNMAGNVRYLFDIKDTHPSGKASKPLGWQITDANRYPTLQALQEKHNAESLPEIFGLQAALFVAQHGKQLDDDLQNAVIGSTLEWAKPQEQTAIFANLITQSAVYMAAVRCGLGDSAVPQDAFADIDRFDTESAVLALGNAVNRAGRQMFAEIGAVVKSIDSVAKTQPKQYDENVSNTNQQEVQDHGYDESERVSGAQDGNEGNAQTAGRENRSAAGEVPAREPLPAVRQDAAGRDAVQRPETDRAALLGAGGADHHEAAGQQPGTGQEQRPVGLDVAHEQSASAGGGTGDAHRDEPVNTEPTTAESEPSPSAVSVSNEIELPESVGRGDLAEETAAAMGLPSLEQQQETIRQLQPRASWQPPIKDDGTHIDEQDIVDVLVMGSGFCEGRFRIQEFFSATVLPTVKEQADWLKKEYGIGGRTWDFRDGERGFLDYDAKGLRIKRYASDNAPDYFRLLPWNEVARRLHLLVHNNQYLDENNKQGYEKWEAEQQAKRDARQAEIDYAEKTIADFCEREGLGEPDFSNLTHIDLAYSTTGDGEHEIQVYANFLRNEIVYLVDGSFVDSARFDNTRALAKEGIEDVEFSQFIDDAEAAYEAYQERHKPKPVEKRPLAAGDTVYLENDHPFTVEEIGIFDVHLRDEDFPLIGRAINRAEFARLLAANPKNQALAAPDTVVEGQVIEETDTPEEPSDELAEETSSGFGEQVLQAAELIALKEAYLPNNYIPPQDPAPPRTPREKFAVNITAIRTLKSIEKRMADGGPHANGEEQESLNLRDVRIFDTKEDMQGNKIRVLNAAATQEAQMKQQQIEDAFKDWIWKDPTRRQMLVKEYNERFNSLRPREYDGSHILFHGMSPEITLRPHQKNAIAHILYGGNTLLAHVVGAGKTYEMVAAAMEKKRLGLCTKTLICVPNHLTEQLAGEALQLYPNANILVARRTDFEKANRKRFCAKIATGNYDIIVIGHSQFERIPLSQERQVEYLQSQIHDVINQVAQLKEERAENFTVKQMERMRKQLEKKLDKLNDQSRKDDVVTFEQLGVDSLMVDEAHAFKNLAVLSKMRNVAGISQTESQRASDLYMKCRYLDEITGSRGVVFATGTPISNSMAELYTMQRYLQRETLEQHGLSSFDAWASTFGETVTAVELAPEGTGYRTKTRFSKFYNLPELMSMFKQVADVQTADMLNLPVPKLVGGKPINVALPPSPQQKQMVADLADRAEEIRAGNVDPTEDNMLKVTNDGRKLALDQRLIDPNLPENQNDKVHACAENVYRIWNDTKEKRLTQLVFCDLSTPKPDGFNVYDDLRNLLITMGIPENEVQFIHSANTEVKKAELFAKVRSGDVRVLMGSTGKMGAGTNVQRLLVATHHLDCGWKPSDIEQRNGRMIRQGNTNAEVYEYRYVTESSFDSYMWQLLETKQKFIGQIMTSKSPARSADDLDDAALSYAEVKALAAGNPMIKEKMDLDIQVARLKTLKTAYNNEHYRLEDAITQGFPAEMRKTAQQLENAKADTIRLQQNTKRDADGKDIFTITLMDTVYTKREDAGKALLGLLGMAMNRTEPVSIGRYKGFDLQIAYFAMDKMYLAYLVGSGINPVQLSANVVGNIMRLDNCLHNLPQSVTDLESKLVQLQKQLENAKEQLAQPFAQADELAEKSKRLAELEALLNLNEKDIVLDTVPDEEQQCRSDNRQRGQER